MIWIEGRIVPDDALSVSVRDRSFEHGLGLFETFRTWNRRPTLLTRHLTRLQNSARKLNLPLDGIVLPDDRAVADLLHFERVDEDVMLRITCSGGLAPDGGATLWMRTAPLPPPNRQEGALVDAGSWRIVRDDPLARHKTLNYWSRRVAHESARRAGFDEVLSMTLGSCVWEGSRTNLFLVRGDSLVTPALSGPIVPGVMRGFVLDLASELPMDVQEVEELPIEMFDRADDVFLTNSVRGIIPVRGLHQTSWTPGFPDPTLQVGFRNHGHWPAPGLWTRRLALTLSDRLASGGPS